MNLCMLKGVVVEQVEFKFTISKIHDAISIFELQLPNNSVVTIKAFDEWADYCYRKLETGDTAVIYGMLNSKMEIIAEEVYSEKE